MTSAPSRRASLRTLPRRPLVVDTRELGRRPGTQRELADDVPAPEGLGIPVLTVPTGAPLHLDLRLESVVEGVLVSGVVQAPVTGECARCLDALDQTVEADVQVLYTYDAPLEGEEGDGDVTALDGDLADLEPAVRDALVLQLPHAPLCDDDCPGLCDQCGERLADLPDDHAHEQADIRWAALAGLAAQLETETDPDPSTGAAGATRED